MDEKTPAQQARDFVALVHEESAIRAQLGMAPDYRGCRLGRSQRAIEALLSDPEARKIIRKALLLPSWERRSMVFTCTQDALDLRRAERRSRGYSTRTRVRQLSWLLDNGAMAQEVIYPFGVIQHAAMMALRGVDLGIPPLININVGTNKPRLMNGNHRMLAALLLCGPSASITFVENKRKTNKIRTK